ncbi:MAG: FGGY family carbohydrate kinase [Calditrichia bacterium]
MNLFLGIDSSTQSTKIICINTDSGSIEYSDFLNYDRDLPQFNTVDGVKPSDDPALSEANPEMWLMALRQLFTRMKSEAFPFSEVRAIAVSGQQHGLVCLDSDGNLTRPLAKLWNDVSSGEECRILTEKTGGQQRMIDEIGNTQRPGYTAGKIFHFYRHEPEAAQRTATFFLVHNYLNWLLTGGKRGGIRVMEPGDVSGMALRQPASGHWSEVVCGIISPDLISKLPPVKPSDHPVGYISPELADQFGFSPDCLIDAGSGDNMYGAVGTGNVVPGIVTISLGTSGTAYTVFDEPFIDPEGEIAAFCDSTGRYLPLVCVSNMANGYDELLRAEGWNHERFNEVLQRTPPGNEGRLLFPWYSGERTPDLPHARPFYFGFELRDFSPAILARSVLEGHVLNLFDGFRRMPLQPREIRLTGGLSRSQAWCQMIADVFETETVPVKGEGAALGAAIHAAWVYLKQDDPKFSLRNLTNQFVKLNESQRKSPRDTKVYRPLKDVYHEFSRRLRQPNAENDPFKSAYQMRMQYLNSDH